MKIFRGHSAMRMSRAITVLLFPDPLASRLVCFSHKTLSTCPLKWQGNQKHQSSFLFDFHCQNEKGKKEKRHERKRGKQESKNFSRGKLAQSREKSFQLCLQSIFVSKLYSFWLQNNFFLIQRANFHLLAKKGSIFRIFIEI